MLDLILESWVCGLMELAKIRHRGKPLTWSEGEKLKLLFLGYNGGRNTGADVRVHEMLRQVEKILGKDQCELTVVTQSYKLTKGYFGDSKQIRLPQLYPPWLGSEIPKYHGLIACEGSMFKSKFADALTTLMVGGLGMAAACNKISVGYGAEAGKMNFMPRWMTSRYCRDSFVIARNEESQDLLNSMGVPAKMGTDTAWTFQPASPERAEEILRENGWDGETPVLAVCPINPFWWPVSANFTKAILRAKLGWYKESHFRSYYFHKTGPEVDRAYEYYLNSIAEGVNRFRKEHKVFPILVAMEMVDAVSCEKLQGKLDENAPILSSRHINMFDLVAVLRRCSMMISSRYHAIVTSMPGLVPSAGITMDERIRNLMHQRDQKELVVEVDQNDLPEHVYHLLNVLHNEHERIRDGIGRTVVEQLHEMAKMGALFDAHLHERLPEFPARCRGADWLAYLPELHPALQELVEKYQTVEAS